MAFFDEHSSRVSRRRFQGAILSAMAAGVGGRAARAGGGAPAVIRSEGGRPSMAQGVASGDVRGDSALVWSRTDRPSRMVVEWSTTDSFADARRVVGPAALPESDFTAKTVLTGLPQGQTIVYRAWFQDLVSPRVLSHPTTGRFRSSPGAQKRDVMFAWSGDCAGQGFGINPERGGMTIFETMRGLNPDFFLHSGDVVYADNPIPAEVKLDDGTTWKNVVTEAKSKVAETLAEYRGNYLYNLLDENLRRFNAEVPQLVQWDDHETLNNWYPGEMLSDDRYAEKSVSLLAARAARAFLEFNPIRLQGADPERIYRSIPYGPTLEVFMLDQRSYRGPNGPNREAEMTEASAFMGRKQLDWLKARLKASRATWKVIGSDMPIGLIVPDGPSGFENGANGDGPPLGRELEFAELFRFIKAEGIKNVVWLTADVHYTAAYHYDPARAQFKDFAPFWEFIAGPLNAGTFGPSKLDDTFGPQAKFIGIPEGMKPNRSPAEGFQFFGTVAIDGRSEVMTVALRNAKGETLYTNELNPERA